VNSESWPRLQTDMRKLAFILSLAALGGCASIAKGTSQSIAITTPPTTGAACILSSGQGNWTVTSPCAVTVEKSKEDIQVHCDKPGWQEGYATIPSNFEGWSVGNILLGGVIGLGVDAATGAVNEYPHAFQVPMTQLTNAPPTLAAPPVNYSPPS
jgi:hypothetical protein